MLIRYLNAWSVIAMPSFSTRPGGAPSIHVAALVAAATVDDVTAGSDDTDESDERTDAGAADVVWPLEHSSAALFAAEKLQDLTLSRQLSADDLRAIGVELMRLGPPVGWLGALLLLDGQRGRR
jgi:hypothetical protein